MTFIQTMEFETDDRGEMLTLAQAWADDAIGGGTVRRGVLAEDLSSPGTYVWTVFFDSAEAAAKNNDRPETGEFAGRFSALCTDGIRFSEYDVVAMHGN